MGCLYCSRSLSGNLLGHSFPGCGLVSGSVVLSCHRIHGSSACLGRTGPAFPPPRASWSAPAGAEILEPDVSPPQNVVGLRGSQKHELPICLWAWAPQVATGLVRTPKGFLFLCKKDPQRLVGRMNLFWRIADIICTCKRQR